jgi:amino acid transporter
MIILLVLLNYIGIKSGAWTQNVLSLSKICLIVIRLLTAFSAGPARRPSGQPLCPFQPTGGQPWVWAFILSFLAYGGYQQTITWGLT